MKKALALLLALAMVFALCACGQQAAPAPAAEAPAAEAPAAEAPAAEAPAQEIVINFPSVWVGTDSKAPYMEKLIAQFNEENAGSIKVVVEEQTDYQAARDKLRTTITTGNTPDLCILDTTYDIKAYTESGKFMDLAPYLAEGWGSDFAEGSYDAWSVDGKVCFLPFESAVFTPIYNTKTRSAGITSPPPMTSSSSSARTPRPPATTPWARWRARTAGAPCCGTP